MPWIIRWGVYYALGYCIETIFSLPLLYHSYWLRLQLTHHVTRFYQSKRLTSPTMMDDATRTRGGGSHARGRNKHPKITSYFTINSEIRLQNNKKILTRYDSPPKKFTHIVFKTSSLDTITRAFIADCYI